MNIKLLILNIFICLLWLNTICFAQENYEIQVYSSPTMKKGTTIFELHSNYTFKGTQSEVNGLRPTENALRESLEITTGIAENFEIGFYLFTNYLPNYGYNYVGNHIRPRITAPEKWHLPFGLSFSAEAGYQRPEYASDYWNIELRPIFDKTFGEVYIALNPVFGKAFRSAVGETRFSFSPSAKISYQISKKAALGLEYYGGIGYLNEIMPWKQQSNALFVTTDLYLHPDFEFNIGVGWGLTPATDGLNIKLILGKKCQKRQKKN